MSDQRLIQAKSTAWAGMIVAILLIMMKGIVGLLSNSRALIADAAYSASVFAGSLAIRLGASPTKTSSSEEQTSRTAKAETITAILVAVLLLVVAMEIGISAVKTIFRGVSSPPEGYAVVAIVISILVKEVMFRYNYARGKKLASQSLIASAWEHRTDMYASFVALVGVTGALIGHSLEMKSLYIFDTVASFFIAILLLKMAYKLVLETVHSTDEHLLHAEDAAELISTVQKIKGIITVDELRARERGHYVLVDVKISVNPKISVHEGHEIARLVKQQLMKRFIHVSDVYIQVNPYDPGFPYKNNVDPDHSENASLLH
ncbi:cation transporter [Paenibacillus psychroresistens]|uniref:Cation transporter n=1 Tax=Paenibacillus psychroresistens TaxID=1778678 RepID=A0A6B8RJ61_9BACL|nr:cation diffusion facilitator family transporter [Paenibacillus psychroresistens]QGQ95426.1 cation transporter [Paenibacillus psychroresistens]